MEIKLLKTFSTIARCLSFSTSAEILNYSQSSISEQIKKLEIELNTVLFERIGNKIQLTSDGEILLNYSDKILELCDEAVYKISSKNTLPIKGEITVAMTEALCFYKLPDLLKAYHTNYPNVNLKLKIGNCYDFPNWLQQNIIDIAFVLDDEIQHENLLRETISNEKLVLVVSPDHPLTKLGLITVDQLKNFTIISTQKGSKYRALLNDFLEKHHITCESQLEFESIEAIKSFSKSGIGIGFLPETTVKSELDKKTLVKLNIPNFDLSISAQVIYHKNKWVSPALNALLDLIDNFK